VYIDADIGHLSDVEFYLDDISGSRIIRPGFHFCDTIFCAWSTDNDGDPLGGSWDLHSARGVLGVAPLGPLAHRSASSFNLWYSHWNSSVDWGPWLESNSDIFDFHTGSLGTPQGDRAKYFVMQNGEIDYDQLETALDHTPDGWLPPPPIYASDIADGVDTRFLLSFGPAFIDTDVPTRFAVVFAGGHDLHVNPTDYWDLFDHADPGPYQYGRC
jgi:hypothetical protein